MFPARLTIAQLTDPTSGTIEGWLANSRSSGSIVFLQVRDGSGVIQAVVAKDQVDSEIFQAAKTVTIESSIRVTGSIKPEPRSPSGWEMTVERLEILQRADDYPIGKKEHGPDFLLDHRHLWLRSPRQTAILRIRDEVAFQLRRVMREQGFSLTDSPILTPTAAEGTTTLFKTDYFGEPAYLAQTGQLYIEATAMALGRVYDFGPTFRAEKSKTRRHLIEFWMLDAEAAFVQFDENLDIQEQLIRNVVLAVLKNRRADLDQLERDTLKLEAVQAPFRRLTYDAALELLGQHGKHVAWGEDFGADEEAVIASQFPEPIFITHYPAAIKAFYMQPDPKNPKVVLNADLLAPEGYGEIVGGSQRIDDYALLKQRLQDWKLSEEDYGWYLDLRKYGSVPHSGFGVGLERLVRWICGLEHIRETIPFPRLLNRLRP